VGQREREINASPPGQENFLAHVPELRSRPRRLIAILLALASFGTATALMLGLDGRWPRWSPLGQVAGVVVGFVVAAQFFWRRKAYRAKYGDMAYRNAGLHFIVPGLPVMFAAIFHTLYLPGERIVPGWAAPITSLGGIVFLAVGAALYVRAYIAFGVDNLAMLYVYFPAEGRMVNSSIYDILRHPAYAGVVRTGLAFGLWRGTWFSILFSLFMPVGLTMWLRLVEEPELIERFGANYADYRRRVPAFWPRWRDVPRFLRFLMTGT
jgi:protein-S-isoprenylcysteine O-methyltransferase Ste14